MRLARTLRKAWATLGALNLLGTLLVPECSAFVISNEALDARGDTLHFVRAGHQQHPCVTHTSAHDAHRAQEVFKNLSLTIPGHQRRQGPLRQYTFDVQFNIVATNFTYLGGWVPDSYITAQMDLLNRHFEGSGISWNHVGTRRILSRYWHEALTSNTTVHIMQLGRTFRVGGPETMNVYTLGFYREPANGFASLPFSYSRNPIRDGVFLQFDILPGGSRPDRQGATLTHEAGHWLGLLHTFEVTLRFLFFILAMTNPFPQGGCDEPGDFVDDTPPEASPAFGCPIGRDSCPGGGLDPINNFMDYSNEECRQEFTPGQIALMHSSIEAFRIPRAGA
ncbi:hypothetical protein FA13DRAFT_1784809 [Coprinellus micaceus]|uniref:Peptidase M43 pregnancy-associated plasma-A domain-containing protein n=1 Tax=Coprinellus micaceus TaxID=71717 RepID=A0A4Y7U1B5_COPMI|nr:hypothetical protein FA13DRAFT_1784809 [Coprinellus micaceus]